MLRLALLLSVSSMIVGCGKFRAVNIGIVDPEFEPYVEMFLDHANISSINVDMYFNDLTGNVIGVCKTRGSEKKIEIDIMWWSSASELDREIVIFHELGHCVLGQGHRNFRLSDGCRGSIMDEYHIGAYCYDKHYDHYIGEMF